jgi:hypothetical protein
MLLEIIVSRKFSLKFLIDLAVYLQNFSLRTDLIHKLKCFYH